MIKKVTFRNKKNNTEVTVNLKHSHDVWFKASRYQVKKIKETLSQGNPNGFFEISLPDDAPFWMDDWWGEWYFIFYDVRKTEDGKVITPIAS